MLFRSRQLIRSSTVPNYIKQKKTARAGARRTAQVYLGTVPDYVSGGHKGLKLSGVMKGGPAEKAGLVAGDMIVRLAEADIENIHDYVRIINMLKIGKTIKVVVLRDQKKHEFNLTPAPKE